MNARAAFHNFVEDELGTVFSGAAGEDFTSEFVANLPEEDMALFKKMAEAADNAFLIFLEEEDLGIGFRGKVGEYLVDLFSADDAAARATATDALFAFLEIY